MTKQKSTTISLVLGSGGARGLAHIGIIRWLEENNFEIKSVSGCSIGAMVGGIYIAGKLDEFEDWVKAITKMDMLRMLDIAWATDGLIKGDKIINTLVKLVGDQLIEDLPIPFTAVAADVHSEKEIWLNSGKLFDAIRASISLPLILTPYNYNGVELIDGGVLNPVPIAPTFGDKTDLTIAVNLGGLNNVEPQVPEIEKNTEKKSAFQQKITNFLSSLSFNLRKTTGLEWNAYDVANQAFDAMQSTIARHKLAAYPPDNIIEIPRTICGTLEFDRAEEMINIGYLQAEKSLGYLVSKNVDVPVVVEATEETEPVPSIS